MAIVSVNKLSDQQKKKKHFYHLWKIKCEAFETDKNIAVRQSCMIGVCCLKHLFGAVDSLCEQVEENSHFTGRHYDIIYLYVLNHQRRGAWPSTKNVICKNLSS